MLIRSYMVKYNIHYIVDYTVISLYHFSYASSGFLCTDVISKEINCNLSRHSCTLEHMNKCTYVVSCIHTHTHKQNHSLMIILNAYERAHRQS